jgi:hypothetical protein
MVLPWIELLPVKQLLFEPSDVALTIIDGCGAGWAWVSALI